MLMMILGFIPQLLNLATAWQKNSLDAQVAIYKAKTGTDDATARGAVAETNATTEKLRIIAGSKMLTWLFAAYSTGPVFYINKVLLIDKLLCPALNGPPVKGLNGAEIATYALGMSCNTDPITGAVGVWVGVIVAGMFGYGTMQVVTGNWFARRS